MSRPEEIVNSVSRISSGTRITGELSSSNDLRIDGYFNGKIFSKGRIIIGEAAEVAGEVVCTNADIWGKFNGDVFVKDILSLKKGAKVNGNLNINKIVVELGVSFNGTCKMITTEEFGKKASSVDTGRKAEPEDTGAAGK